AIHLVASNLIPTSKDLKNIDLRGKILLSCSYAGLAFSNASLGLIHAMAHSLGGFLDLPHGECNAILLDHVMEFNFESEIRKYRQIGKALGLKMEELNDEEAKETLIGGIRDLKTQ